MIPPDKVALDAKNWYDANEGPLAFENVVFRCLSRGVIEKRRDFLMMAERVRYVPGTILWDDENPNCWFVHIGVQTGEKGMTEFWKAWEKETPLKYLAWYKRGKLKAYTCEEWGKATYGRRRR